MKLEDVLGDPLVDNVRPAPLKDQIRELLGAFGTRRDVGQLQVQACWEDLVARSEFRVGPGFAFVETRMLGLLEPALIVGFSKEGVPASGRADRRTGLILVYVGTPVPSSAERELLSRLKAAIEDKAVAERLGHAKSRLEVEGILRGADRSLPTPFPPAVRRTAKSCRAELFVSTGGDPLAKERLRVAISISGAAVEAVVSSKTSSGGGEERLTISFDRGRSLDEIVHVAGSVEGVTVRAVSLFAPTPDPSPD